VFLKSFEFNSEPHTGARPSVRLCVGPELARCVHRNNNASDQLRIKDFQIEIYNRSNGFTAGENILYTMPINTSAPVYRFDSPSILTYTLGLSDGDSQSFVKDIAIAVSAIVLEQSC